MVWYGEIHSKLGSWEKGVCSVQYREKLSNLRAKSFQLIEGAARRGETAEVNRLGRIAKGCDDAMEMAKNLESWVARIENDLAPSKPGPQVGDASVKTRGLTNHAPTIQKKNKLSARRRANEVRTVYLDTLADILGIRLRRRSEVTYETQSGKLVGIPFATELPNLPERWWLGLPDGHFDFIILLCETQNGDLLDFVLPSNFIGEIWNSLSTDSRGNRKLHVFRHDPDYELRPPDTRAEKIRRFLSQREILKESDSAASQPAEAESERSSRPRAVPAVSVDDVI